MRDCHDRSSALKSLRALLSSDLLVRGPGDEGGPLPPLPALPRPPPQQGGVVGEPGAQQEEGEARAGVAQEAPGLLPCRQVGLLEGVMLGVLVVVLGDWLHAGVGGLRARLRGWWWWWWWWLTVGG